MVDEFFRLAADVAASTGELDKRSFLLGAVAIRGKDGVVVKSPNGATFSSAGHAEFNILPSAHAEYRALRKAGKNSVLFVARVLRKNGDFAIARPCGLCRIFLTSYNTKMVYYTIDENLYGTWNPATGEDRIIER